MTNQYMKHRHLPASLRKSIRRWGRREAPRCARDAALRAPPPPPSACRYIELNFPNKRAFNEDEILNSVTLPLRQQIAFHKCHHVISKLPFFETAEPGLIGALALALQRAVFIEGDYIIREGELGREMFFIGDGEVGDNTPCPREAAPSHAHPVSPLSAIPRRSPRAGCGGHGLRLR